MLFGESLRRPGPETCFLLALVRLAVIVLRSILRRLATLWGGATPLVRSILAVGLVGVALLLVVLGNAILPALQKGTAFEQPQQVLFGGQQFSAEELARFQGVWAGAGLTNYLLRDGQVIVPQQEQAKYLAVLAEQDALPGDLGKDFLKLTTELSPFLTTSARQETLKIAKQNLLAQIIQQMSDIQRAWVILDASEVRRPGRLSRQLATTASVSVLSHAKRPLTGERIVQIQQLVAAAVAGLDPQGVAVVDLSAGSSPPVRNSSIQPGPSRGGEPSQSTLSSSEDRSWELDPRGPRPGQLRRFYQQRVREIVDYLPGVRVVVNVVSPSAANPTSSDSAAEGSKQLQSENPQSHNRPSARLQRQAPTWQSQSFSRADSSGPAPVRNPELRGDHVWPNVGPIRLNPGSPELEQSAVGRVSPRAGIVRTSGPAADWAIKVVILVPETSLRQIWHARRQLPLEAAGSFLEMQQRELTAIQQAAGGVLPEGPSAVTVHLIPPIPAEEAGDVAASMNNAISDEPQPSETETSGQGRATQWLLTTAFVVLVLAAGVFLFWQWQTLPGPELRTLPIQAPVPSTQNDLSETEPTQYPQSDDTNAPS